MHMRLAAGHHQPAPARFLEQLPANAATTDTLQTQHTEHGSACQTIPALSHMCLHSQLTLLGAATAHLPSQSVPKIQLPREQIEFVRVRWVRQVSQLGGMGSE